MKMNNFIPYYDKVVISPIETGSILMEDKKYYTQGKVIDIGRDAEFLRKGDIVFFEPYGFTETDEYEGVKHFVLAEKAQFILGKYSSHNGRKNK